MAIVLQPLTPSTLSLLRETAEAKERIIPYHLQNLAAWAYNNYQMVREHGENSSSPHHLLAVELCEKVHIVLSRCLQEEIEIPSRVHGDLVSAFLIVQQMSFRDAVEDIYLFTERHFNQNALMRLGESPLQVDARTVGELTAQLRQGYDKLNV
uniref:Uncharacterized protein n=1 Tax=Moniliophthora roreri TaxID=221103 RepID=A0A0W0FMV9_MONRR